MPLGMDVGLSPGDFVLDGDPVFPNKGGTAPLPIFGPFRLCPNGWMHQDATGYGGRPQPGEFVLDGDPAPSPKRGGGGAPSLFLRVEVRISNLDRKCGALPLVLTL